MTYGVPDNYDISEIERLRRLSITDDLTGLLNRRYFFNRLSQEISKSKRNNRPFSLLILDVDHFKEINDTYGHLEGDEVLRVISKVLLKSVREMDIVTRYAGDEFIAILPESDEHDALPVANRILEETQKLLFNGSKSAGNFTVGVSVGVSTFPKDGQTATELIEIADKGLYCAKQAGRNRVCIGDMNEAEEKTQLVFAGKIPKFIGRADELQNMINLFRTSTEFGLQIALVTGEAGVGKTRLMDEFFNAIKKENIQILKGTCFDTSIPMPYQPFRDALSVFIERDEYYGYSILRSLPESAKIEILKVIPSLDQKRLGISASLALDPIQDEYRLFDGICQVIKKISSKHPVILFLDDIHWADSASLELYSYLVRNACENHIFVCSTYRPEEVMNGNIERGIMASMIHKLSRIHTLERIHLKPFSKNSVAEILSSVFKPLQYPNELVDLVFDETEGNPFFVEELLKSLIENKMLEYMDGRIVLKPAETISLPSSIRDLVLERIDKLPSELQELLRIAAAVGQEFSLKLLALAADKNEGHIQDILDSGMDANIIKEDFSAVDEKFLFTHCKMREVLYYSLRESKRERLHLKIAQVIEKIYPQDIEEHYEELAKHYYFSRNKEKAFKYVMLFARKVQASYATNEAISYFNKTIEIYDLFADNNKEKYINDYINILLSLGKLYHITGEYEKSLKNLALSSELAPASYEAFLNLGIVYVKKADYEKALDNFKKALTKTDSDSELANIETNMSYVYFRVSDFNESEKLARKAIHRLEDKNISLVTAEAYKNLGTVYYAKQMFNQAINYYVKSLEISLQLNDKRAVANSYNNLGSVYYRKNDFNKAIDHLEKCLAIREEIGDKSGIVYSYNNIGNIYYDRGEYENAEKYYMLCLNISEEIGEQAAVTASHNNLGNVYLAKEDFDAAQEHYSKSLEVSRKIGEKAGIARAYTGLGNVYFNKNDLKKAFAFYFDCYAIRQEVGDKSGMSFALIHMAFTSISSGKIDKAVEYFTKGSDLKEAIGDIEGALTVRNQIIRLYLTTEDNEKILPLLDKNLKQAQKLDLTEPLAEIWGLYIIYYIHNDKKEAAEKALNIMDKLAHAAHSTIPLSNFVSFVKGEYKIFIKEYKKALPLLENSLRYRRIKNSDIEYGHIMLDYSNALIQLKRFAEASEKLQAAETFFSAISMKIMLDKVEELKSVIKNNISE
ncbi:tetratricopeptide repeat protein [bacterium]|nr:tetratricopeptide repeat protein [bacterium]